MQSSRNIHAEFHEASKLEPHVNHEELLKRLAAKHSIPVHQAYAEANLMDYMPAWYWPKIDFDINDLNDEGYTESNISKILEGDKFSKLCKGLSKKLSFPEDSVLLHGLSCVASAMTIKKMKFVAGRWQSPVNLYTIISQPPSTAKSAVNDAFADVIDDYVCGPMAEKQKDYLKDLRVEKKELERSLKTASPREQAEIECDIDDITDSINRTKPPFYRVTDATPESLQKQARDQGGWWALVTAEMGLINKVFGLSYGAGKQPELDFVLQSFNGEKSTSLRITRDTVSVKAIGSVAIIAQDIGIQNMMKLGESGQGLPERFLFMRQRSLLGTRDKVKAEKTPYPVKERQWYEDFIHTLMSLDDNLEFTFDEECRHMVNDKMNDYEPHMKQGGKYSSSLLQGAVGKGDGQIYRLASIIHCLRSFDGKKIKSFEVAKETTMDAINMYDQMKESWITAASSQGYAGDDALMMATHGALVQATGIEGGKKKTLVTQSGVHYMTLAAFRQWKKGSNPFKGQTGFADYLHTTVLPAFVDARICAYHDKKIYISPNILN